MECQNIKVQFLGRYISQVDSSAKQVASSGLLIGHKQSHSHKIQLLGVVFGLVDQTM